MSDLTTMKEIWLDIPWANPDQAARDFDNFIRKVQADAWDEGQQAGWCEGYSHGEPENNPYRN